MSDRRTNPLLPHIISIATGIIALVAIALSKFISGPLILILVGLSVVGFIASLVYLAREKPRSLGRLLGRLVMSLVGAVVGAYLVLFAVIYFGQDTIADRSDAFFQPKRLTEVAAARVAAPDLEKLEISTPDGARLRGWLLHGGAEGTSPLVIYFGGSGSESSQALEKARLLAPWSVALVNYRGFGESTGEPTPRNALSDALLVYDSLAQRQDVDPSCLVAMGYSMGTGMAVHLASQRPAAGVVLFAPYDSLKLVDQDQSAIYRPLQPIMKRYFASIDQAPQIRAPLFVLVGSQDQTFPPEVGRRLAGAWGGRAQVKVFDGEDHTMSEHNEGSWRDVKAFLETLQAGP